MVIEYAHGGPDRSSARAETKVAALEPLGVLSWRTLGRLHLIGAHPTL
jgi:hypothetical protein